MVDKNKTTHQPHSFRGKELEIFENLDLYKIYVSVGDSGLKFYKKNGCVIDVVERTLTSIWERPISYITSKLHNTQLSGDMFVGVLFLPEVEEYGKVVSVNNNDMLISDVCRKNKRFKSIDRLPRYVVDLVSSTLGIKVTTPVFRGVMTDEQNACLDNYITNPNSSTLKGVFAALNSESVSSKGLIITCVEDNNTITINTEDYYNLTRMINDHRCDRSFYERVITDFVSFVCGVIPNESLQNVLDFATSNNKEGDTRYLCVIDALYELWAQHTDVFKEFDGVDVVMPVFIKDIKIDTRFIQSSTNINTITEDKHKLYAYKIILNTLRIKRCVKEGNLKCVEKDISSLYKKIGYSNEPKK